MPAQEKSLDIKLMRPPGKMFKKFCHISRGLTTNVFKRIDQADGRRKHQILTRSTDRNEVVWKAHPGGPKEIQNNG